MCKTDHIREAKKYHQDAIMALKFLWEVINENFKPYTFFTLHFHYYISVDLMRQLEP